MIKSELQKLKKKLPVGYRQTLEERTGYSIPYIDKIFTCERKSQKILDAAFELLAEHEEKLNKQKEMLEK